MAALHPPGPKRAKTRSFPSCVLGSKQSSTYPRGYASGACVACGLVVRHFEHPLFWYL